MWSRSFPPPVVTGGGVGLRGALRRRNLELGADHIPGIAAELDLEIRCGEDKDRVPDPAPLEMRYRGQDIEGLSERTRREGPPDTELQAFRDALVDQDRNVGLLAEL